MLIDFQNWGCRSNKKVTCHLFVALACINYDKHNTQFPMLAISIVIEYCVFDCYSSIAYKLILWKYNFVLEMWKNSENGRHEENIDVYVVF